MRTTRPDRSGVYKRLTGAAIALPPPATTIGPKSIGLTNVVWQHRVPLLAVVLSTLAGVGVAAAPIYLFAALGVALVIFLLARGPLMRAAIVIVAGVSLLQLSPGLSVEKFAYLGILIIATLFAAISIGSRWAKAQAIGAPPLLLTALAVAVIVAISAVVALNDNVPIQAWAADIPAYGILAVSIVLGMDLALSERQPRYVANLLFLAGFCSALAFAFQWTVHHGVTQVDVGRFLFASMFLPAAAFCLALAYAFDGRRTYLMAFLASALLSLMLITATRSAFMFVVPIAITLAIAKGHRRWRIAGVVAGSAAFTIILATALSVTGIAGSLDLELVRSRLAGLFPLLIAGNLAADPSLYLRFLQTQALQQAWLQSPWFGVGPGAQYVYSNVVDQHPVDSPMAIFARFGIVGVSAFVVLFAALPVSKLRRGAHWVPATALLSLVGLVLAWSFVSSPLDDKGLALGLILLIGLCGTWRRPEPISEPNLANYPKPFQVG